MSRFRVLSIDGGGIKGVFPVSFLAEIERALALSSVARHFDLIAGTSVGGIIALALGLGSSARDILDFFVRSGPDIFPPGQIPTLRLLLGLERYKPQRLRTALAEILGTKTLGASCVRLLIPAFDATKGDIHIYKTAHSRRLMVDYKVPALEVAMATAAAPTYFPAYDSSEHVTLVDGGVWANNPVALAVVEAVTLLERRPEEVDVLSLGCTEETEDFRQRGHGGWFWLRRGILAAMRGQSRSAIGMARHLTGRAQGREQVVRIDPPVARNRFSLDGAKKLRELQALGYAEARHNLPRVRERFFSAEADPFAPMYA